MVSKGAGGTPVLVMKDDFDRAWRRVGLSLDRLGFTVQDRDRAGGLYYVRYLNPDAEAKKPRLLSRLGFLGERQLEGQGQGLPHRGGRRKARDRGQGAERGRHA